MLVTLIARGNDHISPVNFLSFEIILLKFGFVAFVFSSVFSRAFFGICWLILSLLITAASYGQQTETDERLTIESAQPIMKAAERYKPRPKFIELEWQSLSNFNMDALSDVVENSDARVTQNLIRQVKLKFPLILKEGMNLVGGFGYRHEQFEFDRVSRPDHPFYSRFDDKSLKRIMSSFYLKKDLENNRFLFAFLNNSLNSDEPQFRNFFDQLKSSFALVYGKRSNPNKEVGYGLSFGYDLGQPTVFPLFIYNHDFSLHWGLELLLPKSAKLRYSPSNALHLYATAEVQGASYHVQDSILSGFDRLEFRRSSLRANLTVEREIYDWLWFGATAGYRLPLNLFLSEPGENRRDSIIELDVRTSVYYNFSIFIVPPAKLYKRAKGSG